MITSYQLFCETINESRNILRIDKYGKNIVWERDDYYITVNDIDEATYICCWTNDKKIGELYLGKGRNKSTKDYMTVTDVSVLPKYRNLGLAKEMYKIALQYSNPKYKGIGGEYEQRINKHQIPSIYKRLNAKLLDDGSYVIDRD